MRCIDCGLARRPASTTRPPRRTRLSVKQTLSLLTPRLALLVALLLSGVLASAARADWTTYHGDAARSGVDRSSGAAVPVRVRVDERGSRGHDVV